MTSRWVLVAALLSAGCKPAAVHAPAPEPRAAIDRAAVWMTQFPETELRSDAAIGLAAIREKADSEPARKAFALAKAVADRDADSPLRRAYDPSVRAPPAATSLWEVPADGRRVNVNRVLGEALHCAENGLRPGTLAYLGGPMRDDGGYQTTHALWALALAHRQGCIPDDRFRALAEDLGQELRRVQPAAPEASALAVDLFAERVLMLELAGARDAQLTGWLRAIAAVQAADGAFGSADPAQPPYFRYHATLVSAWALAASLP